MLTSWHRRGRHRFASPDLEHSIGVVQAELAHHSLLHHVAINNSLCASLPTQIPGRENGGNCDIKNLSKGCKVYFPVFVEGANLSMGDMHFSQALLLTLSNKHATASSLWACLCLPDDSADTLRDYSGCRCHS